MENVTKIILLILFIIILLMIVVLAVIIGKKAMILKDLDEKVSFLEDTNNNIYIKSSVTTMASKNEGDVSIAECFIKDNTDKISNKTIKSDGTEQSFIQIRYPEERKVFIDNGGYKILHIYKEKLPVRTSHMEDGMESSYSVLTNSATCGSYNLKELLFLSIEEFNIGGKDCYKIEEKIGRSLITEEDEKATTRNISWIEKETGLLVQSITYNTINGVEHEQSVVTREVKFGIVTDEDLVEPDISEYELQKN